MYASYKFGLGHPNHIQPFCPPPYPAAEPGLQPAHHQQAFLISSFPSQLDAGPFPVRTECPLCKNEVLTETYSSAGLLTWLLAAGLCVICPFGCCLIPCCIDVSFLVT